MSTQFAKVAHRLETAPVLEILEAAARPLSSREIAEELGASGPQVGAILANLRKRGEAIKVGEKPRVRWIGGKLGIKSAGEAFPILISYYRSVDPKLSVLLELDFKTFRRSLTPSR